MPALDDLREQFMRTGLGLRDVAARPLDQFRLWFEQAKTAGVYPPRAMTLATVNNLGRPTARMVVLANVDERGFDFATDSRSPKAHDVRERAWAALVFHWSELERQVRVEGDVERLDDATADMYFQKRARESQLAAWVAQPSTVIETRALMEERLLQLFAAHEREPVSRPPTYAAYRVAPSMVEFWQARVDQIHDRVRYRRAEAGSWIIELLAP